MKDQHKKARIMTALAVLLIATYVFVSLVIVIPNKTITAPFAAVQSSAKPYFSQTWRVFAPNIMKVNIDLEVQTQWRNASGDLVHSDWINLTDIEQRAVAGHVTPSRINKSSWNAAQVYSGRYKKLNSEQRTIVRDTFIQNNGDNTFSAKSTKKVTAQLSKLGKNSGQIKNLLNYDALLVQYTGTFATAYFGKEIERVRWRINRSRPNDFTHRFSEIPQFKPSIDTFGWRQFDHKVSTEVLSVYQDVLKRYGAIK